VISSRRAATEPRLRRAALATALVFATKSWDVAMNVHGSAVEQRAGREWMPSYHACWSVGGIPLLFPPPRSTRHWASKGVFGERIWTDRAKAEFPRMVLLFEDMKARDPEYAGWEY
jgi:hypothetical protein